MGWKYTINESIVKVRLYIAGWLMLIVGDVMPFYTNESNKLAKLMFRYAKKELLETGAPARMPSGYPMNGRPLQNHIIPNWCPLREVS